LAESSARVLRVWLRSCQGNSDRLEGKNAGNLTGQNPVIRECEMENVLS